MKFELSEEERSLQRVVAQFAAAEFGSERARLDPTDWATPWKKMTDLGLTTVLVPEAQGGSGGTLVEACIIAEELGRADAWVPFAGGAVMAAMALRASRTTPALEGLEEIASGTLFSIVADENLRLFSSRTMVAF